MNARGCWTQAVEEADDAAGQSGKANGSRGSAATSIEAKVRGLRLRGVVRTSSHPV